MNCEVSYCIYNKSSTCRLARTHINAFGMCEECIMVSLDTSFLEAEKERQLQAIQGGQAVREAERDI